MANKMTKREVLGIIKEAMADNEAVVAYCDNEITLLDKKNEYRKNRPAKPTKAQLEAEALKPSVLAAVTAEPQTSGEIAKVVGVPFQRVTHILGKLCDDGLVTYKAVKGKGVYALKVEE